MTDSPEDLAAVEQLLSEGDSLRGWLARLEQTTAGVSAPVRERVRGDYQLRLDQITAGLGAHADVVTTKLNDDRREHADLLARSTAARDALAEAELRHAVGEYDQKRFQAEQRRLTSDIESFDSGLAAAAERIARLEAVYALMQRAPRDLGSEFEAEPSGTDSAPDASPVAIGDLAPDSGPLSFRPSGTTGEWPRPVTPPPPQRRSFESAPPLGIPAADIPPRFVRPGERFSPPPAPPASVPPVVAAMPDVTAPSTEPAGAATAAAPAANAAPAGRTLRCGECGAMNRPLEWYCEKCGAELTAV